MGLTRGSRLDTGPHSTQTNQTKPEREIAFGAYVPSYQNYQNKLSKLYHMQSLQKEQLQINN